MPGLVVGVDGSPNSERALEWAMRHAAALNTSLTVIAVHEVPKSYWGGNPVVGPPDQPVLAQLQQAANQMTDKVAGQLGDARPASITVKALSGFVVKVLLDSCHDADLIVLGSRGVSGLTRLLVGSVSSEVIQHSACPVVIVPHHE